MPPPDPIPTQQYRESMRKGGAVVKSHRKIASAYLRGWFTLDVISILPFDILVVSGVVRWLAPECHSCAR